eukprot:1175793-Prorocentrum_minimum.AAC.8
MEELWGVGSGSEGARGGGRGGSTLISEFIDSPAMVPMIEELTFGSTRFNVAPSSSFVIMRWQHLIGAEVRQTPETLSARQSTYYRARWPSDRRASITAQRVRQSECPNRWALIPTGLSLTSHHGVSFCRRNLRKLLRMQATHASADENPCEKRIVAPARAHRWALILLVGVDPTGGR